MSFTGVGPGAGGGAPITGSGHPVAGQLDPVFLAQSRLRKRKFDDCIAICTQLLDENPLDQVRLPYSYCRRACLQLMCASVPRRCGC